MVTVLACCGANSVIISAFFRQDRCMQVLIIFNPTAGTASQQLIDAIEQRLQQAGVTVQRYATRHAGDAMDYLAAYEGELDVVAAAGGDGTLNEVVNGMRQRDNRSEERRVGKEWSSGRWTGG